MGQRVNQLDPHTMSNQQWVAHLISPDQSIRNEAWRVWIREHGSQLERRIFQLTNGFLSLADQEDLYQDVIIQLHILIQNGTYNPNHPSKASIPTFANRVAFNLSMNARRRTKNRNSSIEALEEQGVELPSEGPSLHDLGEQLDTLSHLQINISEREWQALMLSHYFGMADEDIAQNLGLNHGQLRTMLSRSRKKLREFWAQLDVELSD